MIVPSTLILVTGGRDYQGRNVVFRVLDKILHEKTNVTLIHGACHAKGDAQQLTGADRWADEWAMERECPCIRVPARWASLGDKAGPIRNGMMLLYLPNGVVCFPGGAGTADMCEQAEAAGVKVWRVNG